ncbi:hypothetical protein LSG31_00430 [Fodinisporobacter ferrooxydans]|uniref:Neck protein n=1 Tax=Fodinisporobacter ferrooxydans TaxID=2901836 RepID=A0ABY4CLC0_9BACL|nr:hypothetical protein LSG31_00430 [Alicyclobacillaceae bacterium MYW30-H2]
MAGMFNLEIDLNQFSDVINELPDLSVAKSVLDQGVKNATQYVRDVWVAAVQGTRLPGMTYTVFDDSYAKSLRTGESMKFPAPLYGVVTTDYDGADRIETGYGPYDMKTGLLNGPKSRPLKSGNGRYNTVPFRHYTPTDSNSGSSVISIKMRMPDNVFAQAKNLKRSVFDSNGKMKWGESLDWNAKPAYSWTGYQHQSNIYDGMYRVGAARHSQYLTFRRVSTPRIKILPNGREVRVGSAEDSWIHPGVKANPLIESVFNYCMPEVEKNLMELAEKVFEIR